MLDTEMKEQLKSVFAKLDQTVTLVFDESDNSNQTELLELLEEVRSTSPRILVKSSGQKSDSPGFHLERQGKPKGIYFRGIPGGPEFTPRPP